MTCPALTAQSMLASMMLSQQNLHFLNILTHGVLLRTPSRTTVQDSCFHWGTCVEASPTFEAALNVASAAPAPSMTPPAHGCRQCACESLFPTVLKACGTQDSACWPSAYQHPSLSLVNTRVTSTRVGSAPSPAAPSAAVAAAPASPAAPPRLPVGVHIPWGGCHVEAHQGKGALPCTGYAYT